MKVYALVGSSGTGKSHRARMVAFSNNINYIIDDGLLIKGSKVLAGKSAKEENNKIRAVKRAIFMEQEHAQEVKEAIRENEVEKLLVLGTSLRMIDRIVDALELDEPVEIINIKDITTAAEREMAQNQRRNEGKHVIPASTIEVKPKFSGYLMESLDLLFTNQEEEIKAEKTIVRPKFSYYGSLLIADSVVVNLVEHILAQDERIAKIKKVKVKQQDSGTEILVRLILKYGLQLQETAYDFQLNIAELIEYTTGLNVLKVDIEISSLVV